MVDKLDILSKEIIHTHLNSLTLEELTSLYARYAIVKNIKRTSAEDVSNGFNVKLSIGLMGCQANCKIGFEFELSENSKEEDEENG